MKNIDYAIIAAGGNATRFRPYSLTLPKEMLPINGRPAIEYVIDECIEANIKKIIIEVKKGNDCIKKHLEVSESYKQYLKNNLNELQTSKDIAIAIIDGDTKYCYGNAVSILSVKEFLKDKIFCVLFGDDIIFNENVISELKYKYERSDFKSIIATKCVSDEQVCNYGNLLFDEKSMSITNLIQKPNAKISNFVVVSRMILDGSIFNYIKPNKNGENDIGVALNKQAQDFDVKAHIISGEWLCVDSPIKYLEALNKASELVNSNNYVQKKLGEK